MKEPRDETRGWSRSVDGELRRTFFVGRSVAIVATVFPNGPPWRYLVERRRKPEGGTWAQSESKIVASEVVSKLRSAKVLAVGHARHAEAEENLRGLG